jgi:integrase
LLLEKLGENKMSITLRKRKTASGLYSLYLDIYEGGKRSYEYLDMYVNPRDRLSYKSTISLAENIRVQRELQFRSNEYGIVNPSVKKLQFLSYFDSKVTGRPRGWKSVSIFLHEVVEKGLMLNAINPSWLEELQLHLKNRFSHNTAVTYYNKVKACLNLAYRDGLISDNPSKKVNNLHQLDTDRVSLTYEELITLFRTSCQDSEVKRAFMFASYTGLRLSDIRRLTGKKLHDAKMIVRQKKTGSLVYQILSPDTLEMLGAISQDEAPIFSLPENDGTIWWIMQKWALRAKLSKHISFHTSRHTYAVLQLQYGTDIYTLKELMGHDDIKTTSIYARIVDEKKAEAGNRIPSLPRV